MKGRDFDYLDNIVVYIRQNLKKGYTQESLKWALIEQGHSKISIENAFRKAEEELARNAPILKTKPKITRQVIEPKTDTPIELEKKPFWKRFFN